MVVDLNQLETSVTQLETDVAVLGKIANDSATAANGSNPVGTVTTRLGTVVKNIQRVIADVTDISIGNAPIESISGTAYTLISADNRKYKRTTSATAVAITIDANIHSVNDEIIIEQSGAGQITFTPGSGMTLNSLAGNLKSAGQYAVIKIKILSPSVATIYGDLVA